MFKYFKISLLAFFIFAITSIFCTANLNFNTKQIINKNNQVIDNIVKPLPDFDKTTKNDGDILDKGDKPNGENNDKNANDNDNDNDNKETITYLKDRYLMSIASSLNVRKTPEISNNIVGTLKKTEEVKHLRDYDSKWYEVEYKNEIAYISCNPSYTIKVNRDKESNLVEEVIKSGLEKLKVPYYYGADRLINWNDSINSNYTGKTYDCSSFVQYCFYTGANIKLKDTSRGQSTDGVGVDIKDMKRGDIILMTSTARQYNTGLERIGHVAIYYGDGKILHTFGTGGVRVDDYNSFWKGRTILIRRIIK